MLSFLLKKIKIVHYTNYKNVTGLRLIFPYEKYTGETDFHSGEQELLKCYDFDRRAERTYAASDIHEWIDDRGKIINMLSELGWKITGDTVSLIT